MNSFREREDGVKTNIEILSSFMKRRLPCELLTLFLSFVTIYHHLSPYMIIFYDMFPMLNDNICHGLLPFVFICHYLSSLVIVFLCSKRFLRLVWSSFLKSNSLERVLGLV